MLTRFKSEPLMSHVLQSNHFPANFLLRQFLACNRLVFSMIRTIYATIYAIVRQIKRCEHDDTVAIKLLFDFFGKMKDTFYQVRLVTFQQNSRFPVRQSLAQSRFFNQLFNQDTVILIVLRIFQRIQNLLMMDKLFCF